MKTIDRIMYNLRNFYVPADEKYIRQILEAELTAVNGVDEQPNRKGRPLNDTTAEYWYKKGWNESKEQTPVAKEDVGDMGKHIMLQPGEYYKDEFGNIITYEDEQKEIIKDSKPKEDKEGHICGSIQPESEYCDICGKPMGIA